MSILMIVGVIGFLGSLFVMYQTDYGIPGIQKFDADFRLLDMRFRYNQSTVYNTFDSIGTGGIKAYQHYLIVDYTFIAFFLIVMVACSIKAAPTVLMRNALIVLASLRAILDIIENSILIYLLKVYPTQEVQMAKICSWVTTLKFIALYGWLLMVGYLLLRSFIGNLMR